MAYQAINVRQSTTATVTAEDTSVSLTLPSAVAAGSTLVVIGSEISTAGPVAILSSVADTSSNTWGTPTNVRTAGSYSPNVYVAVAQNVAAGSPTVTLTLGAANSNTNKLSYALIEVEKCVTSSGVDKTVTGTASATASTSTAATGTLTQTDNLVILCAGGWFGIPTNPTGWANILNKQNGANIGAPVCWKTVADTASITGTVAHEVSGSTAAVMIVIKAADAGGTLRYKFVLDDATLTSSDMAITGFVWRNMTPDQGAAQRFDSLAGDAVAGVLYMTDSLPAGITITDTLYGSFYNSTDTCGIISGVVESV